MRLLLHYDNNEVMMALKYSFIHRYLD